MHLYIHVQSVTNEDLSMINECSGDSKGRDIQIQYCCGNNVTVAFEAWWASRGRLLLAIDANPALNRAHRSDPAAQHR